ncbi:hypothetical protein BTJ40_14130 [Microbulbifer sp. A4B17]|uniref:sulfotransferase n=1 Tax=Microbulbifer sp. A4B17 TaxID=359370 RepID=UPI000D52ED79|nr:sulfotransferase [Microbulbifer sp. A4B17]AWF81872.1 hypothetical protein BTJ40_14130 [Microbulbifer sp. A4B17]
MASVRSADDINTHLENSIQLLMEPILKSVNDFSIFSDSPIGHTRINIYAKKIAFPNSKFIWIDRDLEKWVKSVENWELSSPTVYPKAKKAWQDREKTANHRRAEYRKERSLAESFHRDFPGDILFMKLDKGWQPLCSFFSAPIPPEPFPVSNKFNKNL